MYRVAEALTRWEMGEMQDEEEVIELFQYLVDTQMVWELQGYYGRVAMAMIEEGTVIMPDEEPQTADISPSEPLKHLDAPKPKRKGGRRTEKQIGALVKMANRKIPGFGIILNRVELENRYTWETSEANRVMRELKTQGIVHWGIAGNKEHRNLVLIEWFEPPSEYSDYAVRSGRQWYPDKWVRVVSPVGKKNEVKEKKPQKEN